MKKPELPPSSPNDFALEEGLALVNALNDSHIVSILLEIESEYPYWDSFKYKVKSTGLDAVFLWKVLRWKRRQNCQYLYFGENLRFSFAMTMDIQKKVHLLDTVLANSPPKHALLTGENKKQWSANTLMDEAIASSLLEGAASTREQAKEMLLKNRKPRNYSEKMIVNNSKNYGKVYNALIMSELNYIY